MVERGAQAGAGRARSLRETRLDGDHDEALIIGRSDELLVREEPCLRTVEVGNDLELVANRLAGREHGAILSFVRRRQSRGEEITRPPPDHLTNRPLAGSLHEGVVGGEVPAVGVLHAEHDLGKTYEHATDDIGLMLGRPRCGRRWFNHADILDDAHRLHEFVTPRPRIVQDRRARIESTGSMPIAAPPMTSNEADEAVVRAADLLTRSLEIEADQTRRDVARRDRLHGIVVNHDLAHFTRVLTDEVARLDDPRRAARRFAGLVASTDTSALGPVDRMLVRVGAKCAPLFPRVVMALVLRRLRDEAEGTIVFDREPGFTGHLSRRRAGGFRTNVNILGEAILGADEAEHRLELIRHALLRHDVNYVSVKISAICAHISPLAFDATVEAVAEVLRGLYRLSQSKTPSAFINLDMEEYRDLALTVAAFRLVLGETEFSGIDAGIVLQAYLPDAHGEAAELAAWAAARRASGGGRIKIRVVKGANLAMESVDAEVNGWPLAPYLTKAEVDASYKALLDVLLDASFDDAVDVGVASHNLFDVAWGLGLVERLRARGAERRLSFEMLEGMAPAQAQALRETHGKVLLYTPVVRPTDFTAAIAYLVRRLDENTAPDNFLHNLFDLQPGNALFAAEAERFRKAVAGRRIVSTTPHRAQDRRRQVLGSDVSAPFENEPNTDFSLRANRVWIADALAAWRPPTSAIVPVIDGTETPTNQVARVAFTCSPFVDYEVHLATRTMVDTTVAVANAASERWTSVPILERGALVNRVGDVVARRRGELLAAMAHDTGKTMLEGDPEISEAIDFARYYARCLDDFTRLSARGVLPRPVGTVVIAPPWNFPFAIALGGVLAAVAAGNTVILKPAPQAVLVGKLVAECCWEAGIPRDVVQFLPCPDDKVGQALITHADVGAVVLTGARSTAELFLDWKPSLRLHAETSGKNALIISASADVELAVKDLVKSAFAHAGQKCSAASLAVVEASVYDDPSFFRRLADATRTLQVGPGHDVRTDVGPLIDPPTGNLLRALTILDTGEAWLVEPHQLDDSGRLWSPGIRIGVRNGSWFHHNECFGPVLGIMRADDLEEAMVMQNAVAYGLTAGLHSLDAAEIQRWTEGVQAGNLYVNRSITGAIVRRQPFGGWKHSVVGPAVKAGGPRYVASLCDWVHADDVSRPTALDDAEAAFSDWARRELSAEHDPSGLRAESNVLRFRRLPLGVAVRIGAEEDAVTADACRAIAAAVRCAVVVSDARTETDDAFASRLSALGVDRLRVLGATSDTVLRRAHAAGIAVDPRPLCREPEIEAPRWLREQSVTTTMHRHGSPTAATRHAKK